MMTAWVALHRLPLSGDGTGSCLVVDTSDLEMYNTDIATDLSVVKIVSGETLCERTLLRGMLVHSAADYAQLLVSLTGMQLPTFVAAMNQSARALKLNATHYVDVTGISAGDTSTAENQATMAAALMNGEPVVQGIVDLSQVSLPVVGVVASFTPYAGQGNVVGVKSGFTDAAGGCDVMAMVDRIDDTVITTYAVVLGEHGDNPLGTAGLDALTLSLDSIPYGACRHTVWSSGALDRSRDGRGYDNDVDDNDDFNNDHFDNLNDHNFDDAGAADALETAVRSGRARSSIDVECSSVNLPCSQRNWLAVRSNGPVVNA